MQKISGIFVCQSLGRGVLPCEGNISCFLSIKPDIFCHMTNCIGLCRSNWCSTPTLASLVHSCATMRKREEKNTLRNGPVLSGLCCGQQTKPSKTCSTPPSLNLYVSFNPYHMGQSLKGLASMMFSEVCALRRYPSCSILYPRCRILWVHWHQECSVEMVHISGNALALLLDI